MTETEVADSPESLQERRENVLLQGQLSALTLISVSVCLSVAVVVLTL